MQSELKICLVGDDSHEDKLIQIKQVEEKLKSVFGNSLITIYSDINKNTTPVTKLKPNIYVFFTDSLEEYEKYRQKLKNPKYSLLITDNLNATFISESVNISSEIIYGKAETDKIVQKIKNHILELCIA